MNAFTNAATPSDNPTRIGSHPIAPSFAPTKPLPPISQKTSSSQNNSDSATNSPASHFIIPSPSWSGSSQGQRQRATGIICSRPPTATHSSITSNLFLIFMTGVTPMSRTWTMHQPRAPTEATHPCGDTVHCQSAPCHRIVSRLNGRSIHPRPDSIQPHLAPSTGALLHCTRLQTAPPRIAAPPQMYVRSVDKHLWGPPLQLPPTELNGASQPHP